MSYLEFFELQHEPFSNAPVSRFYYNSAQHQAALVRLMHVVSNMKGLAILVGDIGQGKTTLARRMLDRLPEEEYEAALLVIIHSGITASWLLKRIALQLGVERPADEKLALLGQLYHRLVQIYESGKKAVVLIDEAQMLQTREIMEEFRGLLNLEVPERKLISFVFFGLPEIDQNLKLDPPLHQRVALKYRLDPFDASSTEAYIKHRLRLAGAPVNPFSPGAIEALYRFSHGTPRVVNTLCDNALFEAFLARRAEVDASVVERIATDLGLFTDEVASDPAPDPGGAAFDRPPEISSRTSTMPMISTSNVPSRSSVLGSSPASLQAQVQTQAQLQSLAQAQSQTPSQAHAQGAAGGTSAARPMASTKVDLAEIDRYLEGLGKL